MEQLLAHIAGDYILQSRWMAEEKLKRWWPATVHGVFYTSPFVLITTDWRALSVISITHIIIDRYRLVKRLLWLRDRLGPKTHWTTWGKFKNGYGGKPEWLHFWIMAIADNGIHLLINYLALANWR